MLALASIYWVSHHNTNEVGSNTQSDRYHDGEIKITRRRSDAPRDSRDEEYFILCGMSGGRE